MEFIQVNMYIAVILENFSQAQEDVQQVNFSLFDFSSFFKIFQWNLGIN